jgi:hypothetical protein
MATKSQKTQGEYNKKARIVSDYENDLIFEQYREGLLKQEFISYEETPAGVKITRINRKYQKNGNYSDTSSIEILV